MYQTRKVLRQTEICKDVYSMEILTEDMAAQSQPGQFVMIKSWEGIDPFLMRPISINSVDRERGTLTLLYKRVGKGTGLLACQAERWRSSYGFRPAGKRLSYSSGSAARCHSWPRHRYCTATVSFGGVSAPGHRGMCLSVRQKQ